MSLATDKISDYLTRYERGDHAGSSKPSYTTQEVSDLLLRSHYSANGKGVTDHAATLTYSFPV
ncbi:Matrixin/peptidase M10 serralysin, partial [Salmonella enterica subsp. enterica serovar 1,4,[5],12:i:-]|nr:Matrixin/peptidase M10 serralysin [Salmonella enterica subsp. enterica serovar 1,4,[5],12:i:-]